MHDSTERLLACAHDARSGPLSADGMRDVVEALVARVREAQDALRRTQDCCRAMAASEPDRTLRGRLEPYAQMSRGIDREVEKLAQGTIGVLDMLKEFEQFDQTIRAEIEAGLSDGKTSLDLGSYFLDAKRLADPKKRGKVVDGVVEEVRLRVETWAEKQSAP